MLLQVVVKRCAAVVYVVVVLVVASRKCILLPSFLRIIPCVCMYVHSHSAKRNFD